MIQLLLFCGAAMLLSGIMLGISIRRTVRAEKGRSREILLLVLWGIVFAVFSLPFIGVLATPHKQADINLCYTVSDAYGTAYYRYKGGELLTKAPGAPVDETPGSPVIYRSDDPQFPYYAAYRGKYYPLRWDGCDPVEYPE